MEKVHLHWTKFFQSFDEFDMIEDEGDEILLTRQIAVSRFNSILSLFIISSVVTLDGGGPGDAFSAASEFCLIRFPGDPDCESQVEGQFFVLFDELLIDDIKITGISSVITGINDEAQEGEKEIVEAFDVTGRNIDPETLNQVVIVKYSDGTSERIFNQ